MSAATLILVLLILVTSVRSYHQNSRAIITGSTGVLGSALVKALCKADDRVRVHALYRREQAAFELASGLEKELKLYPDFNFCDMGRVHDSPLSFVSSDPLDLLLVNNAAVCLRGTSPQIVRKSLLVNTLGPILLVQELMRRMGEGERVTVVNVSSGDGELANLHSSLARDIEQLDSMGDLLGFISRLQGMDLDEQPMELAAGPSPLYSLSKALLNRATHLQHLSAPAGMRIIACCPGNFPSPMSTPEEADGAVTAEQAAEQLLDMARREEDFPSGGFYRHGQRIGW